MFLVVWGVCGIDSALCQCSNRENKILSGCFMLSVGRLGGILELTVSWVENYRKSLCRLEKLLARIT